MLAKFFYNILYLSKYQIASHPILILKKGEKIKKKTSK